MAVRTTIIGVVAFRLVTVRIVAVGLWQSV